MRRLGLALILTCAISPALADVETVTVTARPPDPVGNEAFSVVRLDANALRSEPQLDRALASVPGLSLFRRDSSLTANPTTQGVSLRSIAPSGAGRALVTLDGVPQNDPFGGWVIWSALPAEDIESAEVARGAGAGPYGAGALTGVIALAEDEGEGLVAADGEAGNLGEQRVAGAGGLALGPFALFASGSEENDDGFIPVSTAQRGAADTPLTLVSRNGALRIQATPDADTAVVARLGAYNERRNSGLIGSRSKASGETASLTIAHPPRDGALGWRLQGWLRDSDFANTSVSVAPHRVSTTPANDQYSTPAHGLGVNGAVRGKTDWLDWELGVDLRLATGESREHFNFVGHAFTMNRISGGRSLVGGGYLEAAARFDGWLLTLGARADQWASTGGHLVQSVIASGKVTLDRQFVSRSGVVPTARLGVRRDFDDFYLRSAAYEGFRAPTLNELYRPFRLGNTNTLANPDLKPEQLYGAELGGGRDGDRVSWDGDIFYNQLHRAVTNVTLAACPLNFPCTPAPGVTIVQRQNVGDIDAWGLEGEARYRVADNLGLRAAFDYVDATVHGGLQAPQLNGKRPAQAPRFTLTGSVDATPFETIALYAALRFESARFADDQNLLRLPAAAMIDARLSWQVRPHWSVFLAAENLLNTPVASTESTDGVINYSTPLFVHAGLSVAGL